VNFVALEAASPAEGGLAAGFPYFQLVLKAIEKVLNCAIRYFPYAN
jgi:hypothetical protein